MIIIILFAIGIVIGYSITAKLLGIKHEPFLKPPRLSFDQYLINHHEESERNAENIESITAKTTTEIEASNEYNFITDMYINMILEGKYDIDGLKKEAMEALGVNEASLELLIANYKK